MSWQSYVDQHLVGTGVVSKAAIVGLDGSVWAKSASLNLTSQEATAIANNFKNPSSFIASGVFVQGEKYMTLRADERSVYYKKGKDGGCLVKTNQAVILGLYSDPVQPGQCTTVVEKLADYLLNSGY